MSSVYDDLTEAAEAATNAIRRRRNRVTRVRVLYTALPVLLVFPAGYAGYEAIRWMVGAPASPLGWGTLVAWTLALPLVWIAFGWISTLGRHVPRRDALATLDEQLGLQGRLLTAEEFLEAPTRTPFMRAAIEDAAQHLPGVRDATIELDRAPLPALGGRWRWGVASAVVLVAGLGLSRLERAPAAATGAGSQQVAAVPPQPAARGEERGRDAAADPQPEPPPDEESPDSGQQETEGLAGDMASDDMKQSEGTTGAGKAAAATAAQGGGRSQAAPSQQGQKSLEDPKPSKAPKPNAATKPKPQPKPQEKKESEDSGSTTGRGASKGSNRNPATSDWNSRDHVAEPDDKSLENDEDVDDEDEEQESRGGVQPNLRDRKPPVNRDLRIGFGNRPSPDANGRGGPSEQKKSRGVASLVLGVPIPDRIKGQPNPGQTKITQERIEPKPDRAAPIDAADRGARDGPIGPVARRSVPPWMAPYVREYFLTLRQQPIRP